MSMTLTVPEKYPYVLGSLVGLSAQLFLSNLFYVSRIRHQVFKKELLEKHFGEEHRLATGQAINPDGYPDTGNGRYSNLLSYKDWLRFNIAQRIHYNFIEYFAPFSVITLIAGLHKPKVAATVCTIVMLGRVFYHVGYVLGNANNPIRLLGALFSELGFFSNLGVALCGVVSWLKIW